MSFEEKIKRGLILWLREVHNITAIDAELNESEVERGYFSGCDTCGHGAGEDKITTGISYKASDYKYWQSVEIQGTSIDFLPKLLEYIDRAN